MRKAGDTGADAATIRKACEAYARKYIDIQRAQFKRLGVLGDWDNPYLTLDREYEADELRLFADIVEQGFVYRGKKPVYWSIPCRTALAEAEVEYKDHVSQSIFVKFPVVGRPDTSVVIWTTTPWTLPANLAVAYNSTFSYSLNVAVGEEHYICLRAAAAGGGREVRLAGLSDRPQLDGAGTCASSNTSIPSAIAPASSSPATVSWTNAPARGLCISRRGTAWKTTASACSTACRFTRRWTTTGSSLYTGDLPKEQQMPAEMLGKSILEKHGKSEANEAVLHELRARNALLHQEDYHHSYPHCWRSKTPIIFRAMDQWFIEIDHVVRMQPRL